MKGMRPIGTMNRATVVSGPWTIMQTCNVRKLFLKARLLHKDNEMVSGLLA